MQAFWDISADVYFWFMAALGLWMVFTHSMSVYILNKYRNLHITEALRVTSRDMHGWMTALMLAMTVGAGMELGDMRSLCASSPIWYMISHGIVIAAMLGMAINKQGHLKLQLERVKAL